MAASTDVPSPETAAKPARVLVVDDTPQNVKLLADILGAKGFVAITAANGEEALAKLPAERPDIVLMRMTSGGDRALVQKAFMPGK